VCFFIQKYEGSNLEKAKSKKKKLPVASFSAFWCEGGYCEQRETVAEQGGCEANTPYCSHQKKRLVSTSRFFNEINLFRICEMHFVREILLRNMKYACGV